MKVEHVLDPLILRCVVHTADFYMSLYNVVFTAMMPLIVGTMDIDVNREMSRKYPGINPKQQPSLMAQLRFCYIPCLSTLDLDKYLAWTLPVSWCADFKTNKGIKLA